ncbi:hypothetical protein TWF106_010156 [Orbilia oligospora]|uniref:Uncharacterized protein n=1 Tax=Orbilia oligospora TaxID=2813651 RepID=A0A7C8QHE3_ORBOL|nr:hypothetical protein TWF106_010156 [Orbilia oligospora]
MHSLGRSGQNYPRQLRFPSSFPYLMATRKPNIFPRVEHQAQLTYATGKLLGLIGYGFRSLLKHPFTGSPNVPKWCGKIPSVLQVLILSGDFEPGLSSVDCLSAQTNCHILLD